eukprot:scaffold31_cov198-Alexandrium_tamarense.AAC.19
MASAFTPVYSTPGPSPHLVGDNSNTVQSRSKRTRQSSTLGGLLFQVDEGNEDQPDHISTSASEASSRNSQNSEPPLLDFIGHACMASTWFTSCFPCAVVDINDGDDNVADKLTRASAMNVMYGAMDEPEVYQVPSTDIEEDVVGDENALYIHLPGQQQSDVVEESEPVAGKDMATISLNAVDAAPTTAQTTTASAVPVSRGRSGIMDNRSEVSVPTGKNQQSTFEAQARKSLLLCNFFDFRMTRHSSTEWTFPVKLIFGSCMATTNGRRPLSQFLTQHPHTQPNLSPPQPTFWFTVAKARNLLPPLR